MGGLSADEGDDPFIKGNSKSGLMINTKTNINVMAECADIVNFLEANDGFETLHLKTEDDATITNDPDAQNEIISFECKSNVHVFSDGEVKEKTYQEKTKKSLFGNRDTEDDVVDNEL